MTVMAICPLCSPSDSLLVRGRYSVNVEGRIAGLTFHTGMKQHSAFQKISLRENHLSSRKGRSPEHIAHPLCQVGDEVSSSQKVRELHKGRVLIFSFKDKMLILLGLEFSGNLLQLKYKKQLKECNLNQGN